MACNIAINDVIGIDNDLEVEEIIVSGTAEECLSVRVEINIGDVIFAEIVDVDEGIWTANIEVDDVKCDASYTIEVRCVDGNEDCMESVSGQLRCRGPECPILEGEPVFEEEPCNEDRERHLNVSFTINAPQIVMAAIDFGNGLVDNRPLIPGLNPFSFRPPLHNISYPAGGHNIQIRFEGECEPLNIPFVINACDTPNDCLELVTVEILSIGDCNEDGQRDVELTMVINSPIAQRITVNFGADVSVEEAVLPGENVLTWEAPVILRFSPGRIDGTIVSENCPDVPFTIEIPGCGEIPCPIVWGDAQLFPIECEGNRSTVRGSVVYDNRSNEVVRASMDYGDNQNVDDVDLVAGENHVLPFEVTYDAREEPYQIVIRTEDKCPEKVIDIGVIEDCRSCPEIGDVTYEFEDCVQLDGRRMREVTVMFAYDATHPCNITIDFGMHGSSDFVLMGEQNSVFREIILLPVNEELRGQIIFACDDLECSNVPLTIKTVPDCAGAVCGSFEEIRVNVGECRDGIANVTVEVGVSLAADTRVNIDYDDGETVVREMEAGEYEIVLNHSYREGASPEIEISQDFPADCDSTTISVGEIICDPNDDDDDDDDNGGGNEGGEGAGCMTARWLIAIGAAVAMLAGLLMICVPAATAALLWVAGIAAAVAALAIAARWIADRLGYACPNPCGMNLLITWQVMFGAGIGALYFTSCCPWILWVGLGMVLAALALAWRWAQNCNIGLCGFLAEITVVLGGVVIPVISYIEDIPLLNGCINVVIARIIIAISAGLGIWLGGCVIRGLSEE